MYTLVKRAKMSMTSANWKVEEGDELIEQKTMSRMMPKKRNVKRQNVPLPVLPNTQYAAQKPKATLYEGKAYSVET